MGSLLAVRQKEAVDDNDERVFARHAMLMWFSMILKLALCHERKLAVHQSEEEVARHILSVERKGVSIFKSRIKDSELQ